jgi:hypothetical protein
MFIKIVLIFFFVICFGNSISCGSSISICEVLLERELQVNDSLKIKTGELLTKIDSVSNAYQNKIFLLILEKKVLLDSINFLKSFYENFDTLTVIQNFWNYSLWPYLFLPLNSRLDFIIDSLNRK